MNPLIRASVFTLGILLSFVFFIFVLAGLYTDQLSLSWAVTLTILVNALFWAIGPFISDFLYRFIYKAKFFTPEEFTREYPEYASFISALCAKYRFRMPKMGIISDRNPTAFTYGSTRNNARIIFTEGILHYLKPDEVKAVFAHELGHVHHADFIIMTIAVTLVQVLYELYAILSKTKSKSSNKKGNYLAMVGLAAYIFYWIGSYLILYLSRVREYFADAFSAETTGDPGLLSQALVKIAYGIVQAEDTDSAKRLLESTRALGVMDVKNAGFITGIAYKSADSVLIAEVMAFDILSPWAKILELSSTHPLTGKRLFALERIGKEKRLGNGLMDFGKAFERLRVDKARLWQNFWLEAGVYFLPWILPVPGLFLGGIGGALIGFALGSTLNIFYRMSESRAVPSTVIDQLRNVYASPMRGSPVYLEGQIVGKGVPGYAFSEDMMFQDKTGLIFLNYHSILGWFGNLFFAIGKVKKLIGVNAQAEGWFFRGLSHSLTLRKIRYGNESVTSHPKAWIVLRNAIIAVIGFYFLFI